MHTGWRGVPMLVMMQWWSWCAVRGLSFLGPQPFSDPGFLLGKDGHQSYIPGRKWAKKNQGSDKPFLGYHNSLHLPVKMNLTWFYFGGERSWIALPTPLPVPGARVLRLKNRIMDAHSPPAGRQLSEANFLTCDTPHLLPTFRNPLKTWGRHTALSSMGQLIMGASLWLCGLRWDLKA